MSLPKTLAQILSHTRIIHVVFDVICLPFCDYKFTSGILQRPTWPTKHKKWTQWVILRMIDSSQYEYQIPRLTLRGSHFGSDVEANFDVTDAEQVTSRLVTV